MSDISLNLDGLIAFLVAGLFAVGLLLGIVITAIVISARNQEPSVPFQRRPVFHALIGSFISLLLNGLVILVLITFDSTLDFPGVARWFDHNILIWEAVALGPMIIGVVRAKRTVGAKTG